MQEFRSASLDFVNLLMEFEIINRKSYKIENLWLIYTPNPMENFGPWSKMILKAFSYILPKFRIQLMKSAYFWLSKSICYVKNYPNLYKKFSLKNIILGADFLLLMFFENLNFQSTLFSKIMPLFCKLNSELWLKRYENALKGNSLSVAKSSP